MATPIKAVPTLTGEPARRFLANARKVEADLAWRIKSGKMNETEKSRAYLEMKEILRNSPCFANK